MGNASAANASKGFQFANESARLGTTFLDSYKTSLSAGPAVGSAFQSSTSTSTSGSDSCTFDLPVAFFQSSPTLVTGPGLMSERAQKTLNKLRSFIVEKVLPLEKEIQLQGYFGDQQERWKVGE